jgi:hypothetical protein
MLDAEVIYRCWAAEPVPKCLATPDRKIIQEPTELLGPPSIQPIYLLARTWRGEDFGGHRGLWI